MQIVAYQPELSPALPVVIGNVDYHQYRTTLKRIDQLLLNSGIERTFIQFYLSEADCLGREHALSEGKKYQGPGIFACPKRHTPTEKPEEAEKHLKTGISKAATGAIGLRMPNSPVRETLFRTGVDLDVNSCSLGSCDRDLIMLSAIRITARSPTGWGVSRTVRVSCPKPSIPSDERQTWTLSGLSPGCAGRHDPAQGRSNG